MSNIQSPQARSNLSFSQIESQFSSQKGGSDHHIRSTEGRSLYTSDKVSFAKVKAFFHFPQQLQNRAAKQEAGASEVRHAIDREYGAGTADRVFGRLAEGGHDLSHGVKRSDLSAIRETLTDLSREHFLTKRDDALRDGDTGLEGGRSDPDRLLAHMSRHFDVYVSPEFWAQHTTQMNMDNFGSTLTLSVLDRVVGAGNVTPRDLADLSRILNPDIKLGKPPQLDIPADLAGPLTDGNLSQLCDLAFDRFLGKAPELRSDDTGPAFELNLSNEQQSAARHVFATDGSGSARLDALRTAHGHAIAGSGLPIKLLHDPLNAIGS